MCIPWVSGLVSVSCRVLIKAAEEQLNDFRHSPAAAAAVCSDVTDKQTDITDNYSDTPDTTTQRSCLDV